SVAVLSQLEQYLFGDGLERVKDALAAAGDRLEDWFVLAKQLSLEVVGRYRVRKVALVQLQDVGKLHQVVAMLDEVALQVEKGFDVGVHALALGIGYENDSVNALQYELAAGVVENLAGYGVEVKSGLESANGTEVQRQEVKEKSAVGFRRKADQLALG